MGILKGATGKTVTVVRSGGNLTLDIYIKPNTRTNLPYIHNYIADSDASPSGSLQEGDLIQDGSDYYLVMSLSKIETDIVYCLKGTLYKCNSVLTVRTYDSGTGQWTVVASNIHALITRDIIIEDTDRAIVTPFGSEPQHGFYLFAQSGNNIELGSYVDDSAGRRFRVSDDYNPFMANGIIMAKVVWENA